MSFMAFGVLILGYALVYAGLSGWFSLLKLNVKGMTAKVSVLSALGITGTSGLASGGSATAFNPFAVSASASTAALSNIIPQSVAPLAYLGGNGTAAPSPVSGAQALGGGS
jgi:hypothetical protein